VFSHLRSSGLRLHCLLVLCKLQTNTVHAMPLICRRRIPLTLENMTQMTPAVTTHNLRPLHPKRAIRVSGHRTGDRVKVRRPAAPGLEFMRGLVERGIAAGASVDALGRGMGVVFACVRGLCAFLAQDAELFCSLD
jgi:hypothetical protein